MVMLPRFLPRLLGGPDPADVPAAPMAPGAESSDEDAAELGLFLLRTGRNNWLAVQPGLPDIVMADLIMPQTALVACVPPSCPQASFLVAPDGRPIAVEGDGFEGPAVTARLKRVEGARVEFRHPLAPARHIGVVTGVPTGKPNRVLFDRMGHPVLDRFELHPAGLDRFTRDGRKILAEMARATRAPMSADRLMDQLHDGTVRLGLAEALIRVLPADEMAALARRLMRSSADLALLQRAMHGDGWLNSVMPGLLAWCAEGRPKTGRAVSPPNEDYLAVLQTGALRPQAGLALQAMARRTLSARRQAAVLGTARNEGAYLLDWIAYHRAVGFDHVVLYSNDNDDGSDELLGRLADAGEITWVQNDLSPKSRAQWKAYGHAFQKLPDLADYRWTMVLDIDEHFAFRPDLFGSVSDVIGWHEHQHLEAIALRWLTFAAGPEDVWHDAPSTLRFAHRDPNIDPVFKSLVRSNLFWDSHCHFPYPTMELPFSYRIEDGAPCHHMGLLKGVKIPKDAVTADNVWISHYMFRSAGEALIKIARGYALWSAESVSTDKKAVAERLETVMQRFLGLAGKSRVEDRRTIDCAPGLDAQIKRLRSLPGVHACDRAIKRRFPDRISAVTQAFLEAPVPPDQSKAHAAFRGILARQDAASPAFTIA